MALLSKLAHSLATDSLNKDWWADVEVKGIPRGMDRNEQDGAQGE